MSKRPKHHVNNIVELKDYEVTRDYGIPKGMTERSQNDLMNNGKGYHSMVNKLHLIKLANNFPAKDSDIPNDEMERFTPKTALDLCKMSDEKAGATNYDVEDFIYCKNYGLPINRMVTLRRFPYPCTDNIYDRFNQEEPDIARMVTYMTQDVNKMDEILSFTYGLKWKELTAEMEQASTIGDQSGFSGMAKSIMTLIDPILSGNTLQGQNKLNYDPKHDQNKVYGPVDSITQTHIRDVGLEWTKEMEVVFEYDLMSWNGRTPEFAMKDIIANILAVTYNNAKFWPGSRYWVGERPSQYINHLKWLAPDNVDQFFQGAYNSLKGIVSKFSSVGSAIDTLKKVMLNGLTAGLGKILDAVGRPSVVVMNSLLSGEPTGFWHLTIGNPINPIQSIGNLLLTGVDFKFPTDSLGYGDFPTKLQVTVKLKPGQPKDKAGTEIMFNMGKQRIYHNPKKIRKNNNSNSIARSARNFYGYENKSITQTIGETFDFMAEKSVEIVEETYRDNQPAINNTKKSVNNFSNDVSDKIKNSSWFQ